MSYQADGLGADQETTWYVADPLLNALMNMERFEDDLPRLLVCTDITTGERTYAGPIASKQRGLQLAKHETVAAGADSTLFFSLAPLYPVLELDSSPEGTANLPQP